jgi:hypothetical protein
LVGRPASGGYAGLAKEERTGIGFAHLVGIRLIVEAARQERGPALQLIHEVPIDTNTSGTVFGQQQVARLNVTTKCHSR